MEKVTQADYDVAREWCNRNLEPLGLANHIRLAEPSEVLVQTFARHRIAAEQRGKIEGARLAIEAAADWLACAPPHLSMQEYAQAIRALSPAKIVGEG